MTPANAGPDPIGGDPTRPGETRPPGPQRPRRRLPWPVLLLPLLLILGGVVTRLIDDARHEVSGTVQDGRGHPLPEVRVAVPELGLDTRTDDQGRFSLYIPGDAREVGLTVGGPGRAPLRQSVRSGTRGLSLRLGSP